MHSHIPGEMSCAFLFNRPPREPEKCRIPQDILACVKSCDRRNTVCIAREQLKAQDKRDKEHGASEVSEEV